MESHAIYVSQAEVFLQISLPESSQALIASSTRSGRQFIDYVATFSNSLVFVSPATGQLNSILTTTWPNPKQNNMDLELGPSQRKSAASAS